MSASVQHRLRYLDGLLGSLPTSFRRFHKGKINYDVVSIIVRSISLQESGHVTDTKTPAAAQLTPMGTRTSTNGGGQLLAASVGDATMLCLSVAVLNS
jgi:hypothetical protein